MIESKTLPLEKYIEVILECSASRHFNQAQTYRIQSALDRDSISNVELISGVSVSDLIDREHKAGLEALDRLREFKVHMTEYRELCEEIARLGVDAGKACALSETNSVPKPSEDEMRKN